jgi:phospholipase C
MRNDKGSYDKHTPPDLSSSAAISDYIETRTAAWDEHLRRRVARRAAR